MKDYYYILGVDKTCSLEEIKKAYRKLSHKFHPDKNDGDVFFADRFKEIHEAYETLSDTQKRANYDKIKSQAKTEEKSYGNNFLPIIEVFSSDTDEFEYDKEITIKWKTINADSVIIKPFGNVDPIGTKKYKFKNLSSKELIFELTATNTYIQKSVSSSIRVINKTYDDFYQKVKEDLKKEEKSREKEKAESHPNLEPLIPYRRGNKWGFSTKDKKLVVDYIYDEALPFSEGLAAVKKNGKWGFIGGTGTEIIECKYTSAFSFNDGLAQVALRYQSGLIDKNGSIAIPCRYLSLYPCNNGLIAFREFSLSQKILLKLNLVTERIYTDWLLYPKPEDNKYGCLDKTGKKVIPAIYYGIGAFKEGLSVVRVNSKYGFIDGSGKEVIPIKFISASSFSESLAAVKIFNDTVSIDKTAMFIDKTGATKMTFKYDDVYSYSEGLARVEINGNSYIGKSGFIDKTGKEVINCKYDQASSFSEGLAAVGVEKLLFSKHGYIDKNDKLVIPLKYDSAYDFKNGLAKVRVNGKYGYINKNGVEYWED